VLRIAGKANDGVLNIFRAQISAVRTRTGGSRSGLVRRGGFLDCSYVGINRIAHEEFYSRRMSGTFHVFSRANSAERKAIEQRSEIRGRKSENRERITNNPGSEQLTRREPRVFLPESLKKRVVAAKNIALGFSKIGDADRKRAPRTQTAFAVTGILPQVPASPRRRGPRLVVIIGDPKPAIGKDSPMRGGRAAPEQHLAQTIFASVDPGIFAGPLFDSLHERDRLGHAHGSAGIMAVLFEIEHEQHACALFFRIVSGPQGSMR